MSQIPGLMPTMCISDLIQLLAPLTSPLPPSSCLQIPLPSTGFSPSGQKQTSLSYRKNKAHCDPHLASILLPLPYNQVSGTCNSLVLTLFTSALAEAPSVPRPPAAASVST